MVESEFDRLSMITPWGSADIETDRGSFKGMLEAEFVQVGDIPVDSSAPRITARTSDAAALGISDGVTLRHNGANYVVRSVQNDGTGMTVLVLEAL